MVTISDGAGADADVSTMAAELAEDARTSVDDSGAGYDDPGTDDDGAGVKPGRTDVGVDSAGAVWVSVSVPG